MLAFKTHLYITNELLLFRIPSNFKGKQVEIIVLERKDSDENFIENGSDDIETFFETFIANADDKVSEIASNKPNEFQKLLLKAPTWTDEEYQNFVETRKLFNQWKIG
jgi:hypothetical protein